MNSPYKLRGKALDAAIDNLLAEMISAGFGKDPISRTSVQIRLGLTSRATLVGPRGERIDNALNIQRKEAGHTSVDTIKRRTLEERIVHLEKTNLILINERDQLYEALCSIINQCEIHGLDLKVVLSPLKI
ncbi:MULTISPECIES: hypothetical protein [Deefgea]|uniref:Uncharacterized protein n=1 Tax=Deefgea chitinilytica TaxID=570276 RepID=A0ABS2CBK3_9NEIS|nr:MULTISPECIES: hypothetical protein [Deefgea]MBM5570741.1 hypothetical protein [Deefgea chitinilytica]MBM9887970.1 hypothetical protein [Deefgea sp. CFH1-16]